MSLVVNTNTASLSAQRYLSETQMSLSSNLSHLASGSRITTAADDASIVTAVIGMARSLKLRVVAEGVETPEQAHFLQALDCDEAQGYYFSRPVGPVLFAGLVQTGIAASSAFVH